MRNLLAALGVLFASVPAVAQTTCGTSGVTVTVSPPIAAPAEVVAVTVTNGSSQDIGLPSSCTWVEVYADPACGAVPVATTMCLWVWVTIAPGESYTQFWGQQDDHGVQVPSGSYSFSVWYYEGGPLLTCCAPLTIADPCGTASAQVRNGSGANPRTLASVNPPRLGASWDTGLDCTAHAPGAALLVVFDSAVSGPTSPFGEFLVGGSRLFRSVQAHSSSTVTFSQPVPADVALCGLRTFSQGLCLGAPGPQLSNALDLVLGR